mgnify:CR=1 FL=1
MVKTLSVVKNNITELPNNIEAEQSVIGSILLANEIFDEISLLISSKNFYDPMHQKIFKAIEKLIYGGMLANPITLKNHFENEKDELNIPEYLVKITKFSSSSRQTIEYSKLIYDLYVKRELIKISEDIIDAAKLNDLDQDSQKIIENSEKAIFDLAEKGSFNSSIVKFDEAMKYTIEMASNAYKNDQGIVGVPTGLTDLDDRLGGLHKSDLVIIAGRPSMGKTALALNFARNCSIDGQVKVGFFSLEMSSQQLVERLITSESKIDSHLVRTGKLPKHEWKKLSSSASILSESSIFIDDSADLNIMELRAKARQLKAEKNIDIIFVDYIQLLHAQNKHESRQQEISYISRSLKALAKELNIPVVALSQLSRAVESRTDHRPIMSDLRESGAIEQDADIVLFIFRKYVYSKDPEDKGLAELIVSKHRSGPTGTIKLSFIDEYAKFQNYDFIHDAEFADDEDIDAAIFE